MDAIRMLLSRCRAVFKRQDLEKDLDEELEGHIEMATEENRARGMNEGADRKSVV